ncbi:MAG: S8 family serine peptidase [Vicinamibacterales bacterium]
MIRSTQSAVAFVLAFVFVGWASVSGAQPRHARLSSDLQSHLRSGSARTVDVIVNGTPDRIQRLARRYGLSVRKGLATGAVLSATPQALEALAADAEVDAVSADAEVRSQMAVTTQTTGAEAAWSGLVQTLGRTTGRGVGVAIIDSGIAAHPALAGKVVVNLDFTAERGRGVDRYGHGTHIAGIVAGRGFDQFVSDADSGMAPGAHLLNLKVLDANGSGRVSDVVAAIDWAIQNRQRYAIRVLNLSLGTPPTQSYRDDPLCGGGAGRAGGPGRGGVGGQLRPDAGRPHGAGQRDLAGHPPFAITVGALRTQGTVDPSDDEVAPWSSRGPTMVDHIVKPDLVAPGSRIISTAAAGSQLIQQFPDRVIDGPGPLDYVTMSGTSMSAAVVSGAVALLLESSRC